MKESSVCLFGCLCKQQLVEHGLGSHHQQAVGGETEVVRRSTKMRGRLHWTTMIGVMDSVKESSMLLSLT